jgi:hypothetical protein
MERRLDVARAEGVRSLILRAGDSLVHGEVIGRRLVTEASAQFIRESNTPWRADVSCSPAMAPSLRARWMVYGATPRIVINSPLAGSDDGRKLGFSNDGADCRQCWRQNDDHMRWFGLAG